MLGVKTTCRDRWRQIISEAKQIDDKHLVTLESPIGPAQTDEMRDHRIHLAVPDPLNEPYKPEQRQRLMGVDDFVTVAKERDREVDRNPLWSEDGRHPRQSLRMTVQSLTSPNADNSSYVAIGVDAGWYLAFYPANIGSMKPES